MGWKWRLLEVIWSARPDRKVKMRVHHSRILENPGMSGAQLSRSYSYQIEAIVQADNSLTTTALPLAKSLTPRLSARLG